jgi:hypothetical protein
VTESIPPAQNRLEQLLEEAVEGDVDAQERFRNVLLTSELYIVGEIDGPVERIDGDYVTANVKQLQVASAHIGDEPVIIAFTSPVRLKAGAGADAPYVGMLGRELLARRPRGLRVLINYPGLWYGVEYTSEQADRLLDGGIVVVPAGTVTMLGLAAERPDALVEQLREWLSTRPDVLSARLGQMFEETSEQPPHPLVGLELAEGARMETVFASVPKFDVPVDLAPLEEDHPLGGWLLEKGEEIYRK